MPTLFVGIDVAQANLDVSIQPLGKTLRVDNTPAGHRKLIGTLRPLADNPTAIRVGLESTGGLELPVAIALEEAGFEVAVIKPERVRYFAKAAGQLAKTDAIDAAVIAQFVQAVPLTIQPLPPEEIRHFRDLLDRRNQLVDMRTMESNRLGSTTEKRARKSIERHVAWIDKELGNIEAELDSRIAANPRWEELDRIIQSIPGLGPQTARTLIGQLPELGRVDRKVIGQLVGLAPVARDSGQSEGPRHIVGGRKQVRNVLYMASVVAIRHNPIGKELYVRLKAKGKSSKAALIAVAHKLLTIINAMVKNKQMWRHSDVAISA
jgi:transposase